MKNILLLQQIYKILKNNNNNKNTKIQKDIINEQI